MNTLHIDHPGPFPKSKHSNLYLIVGIDGFIKFWFLKQVKSTKTEHVIVYLKDICSTYGVPKTLIIDRGSCFTSKVSKNFCQQNNIKHVLNAVATPRANGQAEHLNRTILDVLLASTPEEELWDEKVRDI